MSNFTFFYGGYFSNWAYSPFTHDDVVYNTGEQYMMHMKALLFNDIEVAEKIMATNVPYEQKALGRQVKNFDKTVWEAVCIDIVAAGLQSKFSQNPHFKQALLNTGDTEIVEASPTDRIWGIGLAESDPKIWDRNNWRGTNWLGIALMRVRDELRKEAV